MLMTSNGCIPVKNTLELKMRFCHVRVTQFCYVRENFLFFFSLIRTVHEFDFRPVTN